MGSDPWCRTTWARAFATAGQAADTRRRPRYRATPPQHKGIPVGGVILLVLAAAVLAPVVTTNDPQRTSAYTHLRAPNAYYFFGTDSQGRDVYSRVVYGARLSLFVLGLREFPFVEAVVASGNTDVRIMWRPILPNTLAPLIVQAGIIFADAILAEATFSFLGAGAPPALLLALCDDDAVARYLAARRPLPRYTPFSITDEDALWAELRRTRGRGLAVAVEAAPGACLGFYPAP
jgi:ABC-type dipeptide/oligopeptide/nickel transport system permease subunit